jgi:hypothetical protein
LWWLSVLRRRVSGFLLERTVPEGTPQMLRLSRALSNPREEPCARVGGPVSARDSGRGKRSRACEDGDGPSTGRPKGRPRRARSEPPRELPRVRPVSAEEKAKRARAGLAFEWWLQENVGFRSDMLPSLPLMAGEILAAYGRSLYRHREGTIGDFSAAVQYVTDIYPFMKGKIRPAWDQARVWRDLNPSDVTTPCPLLVLKGATVTALTWGWGTYARYLVHGFQGCHRGCELRVARRCDLLTPRDGLGRGPIRLYTRVVAPKNSWAGPRIQHSMINQVDEVHFIERWFQDLAPDDMLYDYSSAMTTGRWDKIMSALGVSGLVPRSLRGGGTVFLYESTEDMAKTIYQGRWTQPKNAEYYLQEAVTARFLSELPAPVQQRLLKLEALYDRMIRIY